MPKTQPGARARRTSAVRRPPSQPGPRTFADLEGRDFMTAAEMRGEASYLVLNILLKRIPRSMCMSVMAQAYSEADTLGIDGVTAEVNALFSAIEFDQGG